MFKKFIKKMLRLCETPSVRFRNGIGVQLARGFEIGLMKGRIAEINHKRSKYILRWYSDTEYKPVQNAELTMRSTIARYEDDF